MNLDGLTLTLLTKELHESLLSSQIQRINQLDKTTLVFQTHGQKGTQYLVITMGSFPAIFITDTWEELPKEPTGLAMYLRKHLENARITHVEQVHDDRIIKLTLDKLSLQGMVETYYIYVELMGKHSNAIITTAHHEILEALIHVTPYMNAMRTVQPKEIYVLPPHTERMCLKDFDAATLKDILMNYKEGNIEKTLRALFNGIGPYIMSEIVNRAQLSKNTHFETCTEKEYKNLSAALVSVWQDIERSTSLYQYRIENKICMLPFVPTYAKDAMQLHIHTSPSSYLKEQITLKGSMDTSKQHLLEKLKVALQKEELRYQKIKEEFNETKQMDLYKLYGDTLMIHSYLKQHHDTTITLANYLEAAEETLTIPIHPDISIVQNAQVYYKKYQKLKSRLTHGKEQLDKSLHRIKYIQSVLYSLKEATNKEDLQEIRLECEEHALVKETQRHIKNKNIKEGYMTLIRDGYIIYIGKNNKQNAFLTHQKAKPFDIWFHVKEYHGSHVILHPATTITEEMIYEAASYAAYYSEAKDGSNVPVDYTDIRHIKKIPGVPLSLVTFKENKTIYVNPKAPLES